MRTVYLDLTHLGRHVTGIERVTIEQFEKVAFTDADVRHVRSSGLIAMIWKQQIWLPLLALLRPSALFVFPGFPPSPLFRFCRERVVLYVHDAFLITRRGDLSLKAKLYMAAPFRMAVTKLKYFLANSEKTRTELKPFIAADAAIALYRPSVGNVFQLSAENRSAPRDGGSAIRLVALGTVEPRKNYGAALDILDALRARGLNAELHIIGRKGWGPDAERLAAHPGVTVHGYLSAEDARAVLQEADLYICTSHDEGLGLPLLEAQYAGLPVAAPDAPVFREVLDASGLFIDPANPATAAEHIAQRLASPGFRQAAAADALANVQRWNELATRDRERAIGMFRSTLGHALSASTTKPA
jgi:glycosyltransferase involved in cell wall biosynthesis